MTKPPITTMPDLILVRTHPCSDPRCAACLARTVIDWDSGTRRLRRGQG